MISFNGRRNKEMIDFEHRFFSGNPGDQDNDRNDSIWEVAFDAIEDLLIGRTNVLRLGLSGAP